MNLTNAIAIIRRQDAQVKVNVPATANRKAYSYVREGSGANDDGPLPDDWNKTYTKSRFEKETGEHVKNKKQWEALKAENEKLTKYGNSRRRKAAAMAIPLALSSALVAYGFAKDSKKEKELKDREDTLKCTPGNKPCGKRCIPEKQNCAVETAKMAVGGAVAGGALGYNLAGPLGAAYGGAGGLVGGGLAARGSSQRTISIAANLAGLAGAATLLSVASKARSGETSSGEDKTKRQKAQEDYEKKVQEQAQNEAYKTMGIKKGATPDEVRTAYKAAARKYHPDINKDPKAAEKFAKINAAMDILDPKRKAKADESQADNAKRAEQGAKRAGTRFNSLQARIDSFMFSKIQDAYKTIQKNFSDVSPDFWYSR